jgi:hypothetical protein
MFMGVEGKNEASLVHCGRLCLGTPSHWLTRLPTKITFDPAMCFAYFLMLLCSGQFVLSNVIDKNKLFSPCRVLWRVDGLASMGPSVGGFGSISGH